MKYIKTLEATAVAAFLIAVSNEAYAVEAYFTMENDTFLVH